MGLFVFEKEGGSIHSPERADAHTDMSSGGASLDKSSPIVVSQSFHVSQSNLLSSMVRLTAMIVTAAPNPANARIARSLGTPV